MVSRRALLLGLGTTALVGVAGGTVFATTRTPQAALAPWQSPGALAGDPRIKALEWAVLAPSPHNRQPWLVALDGDDTATIYCDLERRLPMTDPFDRQIVIGLGAFLELFVLAARNAGSDVAVELFPEGAAEMPNRLDDRPVARLVLTPGGTADPLFSAVPYRRSVKEPFDTERPVAPGALKPLAQAVRTAEFGATLGPQKVTDLKSLAQQAWTLESRTPRTHQESVDLMRIGKSEINASPDGIDLGGVFLETLSLAGLLSRESLADPSSQAFAQGEAIYAEMIGTSQGFVWLNTPGNTRVDQIEAGRDWLRLHLAATEVGLAVHPMSQVLQEFEEMAGLRTEAHAALGVEAPATVQMLARIGYGPDVPPSPRWPAETRIV